MPSKSDVEFFKIAVAKGFVDNSQGKRLLTLLSQSENNIARLSIDKLMVMEEILSPDQVKEIQEIQKRRIFYCACGQKLNIFSFNPGEKAKCKSCERVIDIPDIR
jgi:hypothetical protein